jgi:hypothetical protein
MSITPARWAVAIADELGTHIDDLADTGEALNVQSSFLLFEDTESVPDQDNAIYVTTTGGLRFKVTVEPADEHGTFGPAEAGEE